MTGPGWAYYNEIDTYAADWIRNLIKAGVIADGVVDSRSIEDVHPIELREFAQCHFFAGIGVWSRGLRLAGWPDDRRVWTGSCPCQPFSTAGKGAGFADERHLWPAWHHLIEECRPAVVFGEQVASKDVDPWVDLVQADMEALGYAVGAVPFPSAGVGAPHIRDRCYFVADALASGQRALDGKRGEQGRRQGQAADAGASGGAGGLDDPLRDGRGARGHAHASHDGTVVAPADDSDAGRLADDDDDAGLSRFAGLRLRGSAFHDADGRGPVRGFWADAEWLPCRDDKWRPVEPGTFPLAHGAAARVGRLRAYGNAINAEAARAFIESYLDGELA